jgi:hypothetical protein
MTTKHLILNGGLAGVLAVGAVAAAWSGRPYTSNAVLRVVPSSIPERFVVSGNNMETDRLRQLIVQPIMTRGNLTSLIETYNLYPAERARKPTEDVIEQMRAAVRIDPVQSNSFSVSFTYPDPALAQQITSQLVARLIAEYSRFRTNQAAMTLQFLRDSAEAAAADFEAAVGKLRVAQSGSRSADRLELDVAIARSRYENLSARRAEAEMLHKVERMQQGPSLEVLDPASLPSEWRPSVWLSALGGLFAGAGIAWLVSFLLSLRPGKPALQVS